MTELIKILLPNLLITFRETENNYYSKVLKRMENFGNLFYQENTDYLLYVRTWLGIRLSYDMVGDVCYSGSILIYFKCKDWH